MAFIQHSWFTAFWKNLELCTDSNQQSYFSICKWKYLENTQDQDWKFPMEWEGQEIWFNCQWLNWRCLWNEVSSKAKRSLEKIIGSWTNTMQGRVSMIFPLFLFIRILTHMLWNKPITYREDRFSELCVLILQNKVWGRGVRKSLTTSLPKVGNNVDLGRHLKPEKVMGTPIYSQFWWEV